MTYSFDESAALGQPNHALVGDLCTTRNVEALKALAVFGDGDNSGLGDLVVTRYIESKEVAAVLHQGDKTRVGQAFAVGQGEALDAGAHGKGHNTAVIDLVGDGGQVQALDEVVQKERRKRSR